VTVKRSEDVVLQVDADHIEQALINLVRNAADAALSRMRLAGARRVLRFRGRCGRGGGHFGPRQWAGADQRRQSVCAVLHDQAGRYGYWAGAGAADRAGASGIGGSWPTGRMAMLGAGRFEAAASRVNWCGRLTPSPGRNVCKVFIRFGL